MLKIHNLSAYYGSVRALSGVTMRVREGEIVTLIGANGAGKTTLLNAICGLVRKDGDLDFAGRSLMGLAPEVIVGLGISQVPEGRQLFAPMTVAENLELGAYRRYRKESKAAINADLERVFQLFPRLQDRLAQQAGTMSGGEQQMLAIGRALMARPRLLLLDEPSLGLAPIVVEDILARLSQLRARGRDHSPGGAERPGGAQGGRPGLRPGNRPHHPERQGRRPAPGPPGDPGLPGPGLQGVHRGQVRLQ